ncbi:MAG: hypothetical protein P1U78_02830 [Alcanivoracaceae bacterium]|nr:hypothetical protein [Alcanivoracaceae bacterium]
MKKLFVPMALLVLSGCAVKPQSYDLSTANKLAPIATKENIPSIFVSDFKYEPNVRISQNTISQFGCLLCKSDGSSLGFVFEEPVGKIIQAEVRSALAEVIIPTSKTSCELGATIHLVAWDSWDGDTTVDLTFILSSSGQIKFIKRIRGHHESGIFEIHKVNRMLAKASRNSVEKLVTNDEFLKELSTNCPKL